MKSKSSVPDSAARTVAKPAMQGPLTLLWTAPTDLSKVLEMARELPQPRPEPKERGARHAI